MNIVKKRGGFMDKKMKLQMEEYRQKIQKQYQAEIFDLKERNRILERGIAEQRRLQEVNLELQKQLRNQEDWIRRLFEYMDNEGTPEADKIKKEIAKGMISKIHGLDDLLKNMQTAMMCHFVNI